MPHVTIETATVYKAGSGRRYFTKSGAYYGTAKALVVAKYPHYEGDPAYEDAPVDRWEKRTNLFYDYVSDWAPHGVEPGPSEEFNPDKWQAFIKRVARFPKFLDSRPRACSACESTTLIECKDGGKVVGMGCTECGAMFDLGGES